MIEKKDINISKYYDPFFAISRANYRWQFAMPTYNKNILDCTIVETGIIPSLISWKSERPINQMKKNQFELISFEIELSKTQKHFNDFFKSFGEIEHVSFLSTFKKKSSNFKLNIKDNLRDIIISL